MTWVRNLRLPDARALTVARQFVDPDENDLTWAQLSTDDRYTWRAVAIQAGIDISGWDL